MPIWLSTTSAARQLRHYATNAAPLMIGLLTAPLTARSLGPNDRGLLVEVLLVSGILVVVSACGMGWLAREDAVSGGEPIWFWSRWSLLVAAAFFPVSLVAAYIVDRYLELPRSASLAAAALLLLSGSASIRSVDANALLVAGNLRRYGLTIWCGVLIVAVGTVALFVTGHLSLATAIWLNCGLIACQTILFAIFSAQYKVRPKNATPNKRAPSYSRIFRAAVSQIVDALTMRFDSISVASSGSSLALGLYSIAALGPQILYQVVNTIVQRAFSASRESSPSLAAIGLASMVLTCLLSLIGYPLLFALIPVFFGDDFNGARTFLLPAAALSLGLAVTIPSLQYTSARRMRTGFIYALLTSGGLAVLVGSSGHAHLAVSLLGALFLFLGLLFIRANSFGQGRRSVLSEVKSILAS